ncbi:MAG TPA: phosphomannomutase/phosphoglucomutase [Patescibacteria group bacterium]|nr:phosphomannomutase/phosphoglucomutase [Patescibacteria group bacterium]
MKPGTEMNVFKACDIRGLAGSELTDSLARRIALALGTRFQGQRVAVGGDVRLSTPGLQRILTAGLAESGCQVYDLGTVATPVFYYAIKALQLDGGVMVTASHNPAPYNGFKMVFGPQPVTEADVAEIGRLVVENSRIHGEGSVQPKPVIASYLHDTAAYCQPGKLHVVVDAGNGATAGIASQLFRKLGYKTTPLFDTADGTFPHRPPNPALAENLAALGQAVRDCGADLGVAFDGDGDRVGFVDENGRVVSNDDIIVLLARQYLEQEKGAVIYDAKCSMVAREEIEKAGGRAVMARAGHTFCKDAFQRENALFAGEISGHFFFRELGYDDGMFAGVKVCEFVAKHGRLAALAAAIPKYPLTPDIRVPYLGRDKEAVLDALALAHAAYQPNRIDGVRLEFPDGWGMIRASVTEPLFTLRFEARTVARLKEIAALLAAPLPEELRQAIREKTPEEWR